MDTEEVPIGRTPVELKAALSLTDGTMYLITVTGSVAAYIAERTSAPSYGSPRHRIPASGEFYFTPAAARGVYVWAKAAGEITVSEA